MAKETDVIGQQFARETTSDVTKEMIRAGSRGESRIAAGLKAAWAAKTGSMYGRDTTKVARVLRLLGQQNTAKWYDRFFAVEKKRAERSARTEGEGGEGVSDSKIAAQVKLNTGLLKAQNKRIDNIHGLLDVVASDVLTIKTIVTPRTGVAKVGGLANQYNDKAQAKANAVETTKLVRRVMEEEKKRVELRNKFAWKDTPEKEKKETDVEKLGKKIDHIGIALGQMKNMRGGFLKGILGSLLSSFIVRAALVGMAGYIGLKVGEWLNDTFKISQRLGDFFDEVRDKLGLEKKYDPNADNVPMEELIRRNNEKLAGTAWKQVAPGVYEKDGQQFKDSELTEETKLLFRNRGIGHGNLAQPAGGRGASGSWDEEPSGSAAPTGATQTGSLKLDEQTSGDKYSRLGDLIARGEGTSDEKAAKKGYASGYDTTLDYGKWGNTYNGKPVSQMTLGELRLFQESMLEKQRKAGIKEPSSAVGKYQFVKTNLFGGPIKGGGYDPGLLDKNNIPKSAKFDGPMQERLFRIMVKEQERLSTKNGVVDNEELQYRLAGKWASLAKDESDVGYYPGQKAPIKTADIQPVLQGMGKPLDQNSRENQKNNSPANVTVVAPQQQTVVNNIPNPAPPRPVSKASPLSSEPSFVRGALGDIPHPTGLR